MWRVEAGGGGSEAGRPRGHRPRVRGAAGQQAADGAPDNLASTALRVRHAGPLLPAAHTGGTGEMRAGRSISIHLTWVVRPMVCMVLNI